MRRSKFSLSHYKLTTMNLGQLIPIGLVEVLPGDSFMHSTSALLRMSPLAAPVMHPVTVRIHHFFVPHRLVWEQAGGTSTFENFMTGGSDGADAQTVPTINITGAAGDLMDHYGVPPTSGLTVSALPIAGFNAIYNEYYRDQDLVNERAWNNQTTPLIAWEKDYFTSARPWPQKGPDVTLPIAGQAPVTGLGSADGNFGGSGLVRETDGSVPNYANSRTTVVMEGTAATDGFPNVYADLSQADAVNINEFRRAFALQRYQEARSRYGSRYTEYLRYLGVRPSDARLDRPEFLGGGRARVAISEVLQTAPEGAAPARDYGVGDMYGHGVTAMRSNRYLRFFEEHGYVHSMLSVRPKAIYQDGVHRSLLRQTKEDFWQRELQHIGQQEVWQGEIYRGFAARYDTFGYQDRYREYREQPSNVSGEFRSTLNYWHLARSFGSAPTLNASFVDCDPSKRIFNEQTQNSLWVMAQHRLVARRLVARRATARIL